MPVLTCFGCRRIESEAPGGKGRPNYSLRRPMSALSAGNSNSRWYMTASSTLREVKESPSLPSQTTNHTNGCPKNAGRCPKDAGRTIVQLCTLLLKQEGIKAQGKQP